MSLQRKPPREYQDWFVPISGGLWALKNTDLCKQKMEAWRTGVGKGKYWREGKERRKQFNSWMRGAHHITYGSLQILADWSGWTVDYWMGPRPDPDDDAPEPLPDELPESEHKVDLYWVKGSNGHLVIADEYLEGFLERVDELLGPNMTGGGRWSKSETWRSRRTRWKSKREKPTKEIIIQLCLRTLTRLRWWMTGEGDVWAGDPPGLPDKLHMGREPTKAAPSTPPDVPPRAMEEDVWQPDPPPKIPSEPAPYNFFAGCDL